MDGSAYAKDTFCTCVHVCTDRFVRVHGSALLAVRRQNISSMDVKLVD